VDSSEENADWIKSLSWDLPDTPESFIQSFNFDKNDLKDFLKTPAAIPMPKNIKDSVENLISKADSSEEKGKDVVQRNISETTEKTIRAIIDGFSNTKTLDIPDLPDNWKPTNEGMDVALTNKEKDEVMDWFKSTIKKTPTDPTTMSENALLFAYGYLSPYLGINGVTADPFLPSLLHDTYVSDNGMTFIVKRMIKNPLFRGDTDIKDHDSRVVKPLVAKALLEKIDRAIKRLNFPIHKSEVKFIISSGGIDPMLSKNDGKTTAYTGYPQITFNETAARYAAIGDAYSDDPVHKDPKHRKEGYDLGDEVIFHEIGHWLHQMQIINTQDSKILSEIEDFMSRYPINEYGATSPHEYIAESYSSMMTSKDGYGMHQEVSLYIKDKIHQHLIDLHRQQALRITTNEK